MFRNLAGSDDVHMVIPAGLGADHYWAFLADRDCHDVGHWRCLLDRNWHHSSVADCCELGEGCGYRDVHGAIATRGASRQLYPVYCESLNLARRLVDQSRFDRITANRGIAPFLVRSEWATTRPRVVKPDALLRLKWGLPTIPTEMRAESSVKVALSAKDKAVIKSP